MVSLFDQRSLGHEAMLVRLFPAQETAARDKGAFFGANSKEGPFAASDLGLCAVLGNFNGLDDLGGLENLSLDSGLDRRWRLRSLLCLSRRRSGV